MKRFWVPLAEFIVLVALSYGLFLLCADLYTRHNNFPANWHPDEPGKAAQLIEDRRNYNHPQLMLEATLWLIGREEPPQRTQAVVETGRRASAYMAAAGAVMLAWAGYFGAGRIGFLLVAVGAGLCPAVLCHAHYFKEDASLCMGVAAVICVGAAMTWRWHWMLMLILAALLGGACGVAASGKYVGAVMAAPAVLLSMMVCWRRWWIMPLLPLIVLGSGWQTWKTINYRAWENWERFEAGFEREKNHSIDGHDNVMIPRPNAYFSMLVWEEAMPHVKALAVATPVAMVAGVLLARRRRRVPATATPSRQLAHAGVLDYAYSPKPDPPLVALLRPPLWKRIFLQPLVIPQKRGWLFMIWLALCMIAFGVMLSQNTIPFYRYSVPLTMMLYTFTAVGVVWVAEAMQSRFTPAWATSLALLALIAILQWNRCQDYLGQFANDSRHQLQAWCNTLPAGTSIVCDSYTELENGWNARWRTRLEIERYRFAAEVGSVDNLVRRRVNYVIIAGSSFERYIDPAATGVDDQNEFLERQRFYLTLFAKYPIVKSWVAEHPMRAFTNADIYVFKLPDPDGEPRRRRGPFR